MVIDGGSFVSIQWGPIFRALLWVFLGVAPGSRKFVTAYNITPKTCRNYHVVIPKRLPPPGFPASRKSTPRSRPKTAVNLRQNPPRNVLKTHTFYAPNRPQNRRHKPLTINHLA